MDTKSFFLEIASRIGGARIRQNLQYKLTYNPLELLLTAICSDTLPILPTVFPVTGWLLTAKMEGVIQQLPELTETIKNSILSLTILLTRKLVNSCILLSQCRCCCQFSCHGSTFRETKNNLLGAETWVLENTRYKNEIFYLSLFSCKYWY